MLGRWIVPIPKIFQHKKAQIIPATQVLPKIQIVLTFIPLKIHKAAP